MTSLAVAKTFYNIGSWPNTKAAVRSNEVAS